MQFATIDRLLKLKYSIFDIPFTLAGAVLPFADPVFAAQFDWTAWQLWLWIVLGMTLARGAGMAFNEYIDRRIDAANPRTQGRAIPTGAVRPGQVLALAWLCSFGFMVVGCCINPLTAVMAPVVIGMIAIYSYLKRITPLCHFFLGFILALGPMLAAVVISNTLPTSVIWLGIAFFASITANDVIYGTQDYAFDVNNGVWSLPAWLGRVRAIWVARGLHSCTVIALLLVGVTAHLSVVYYLLWGVVVGVLVRHYLHLHRREGLQTAFMWCNKAVALLTFFAILGGLLWRG